MYLNVEYLSFKFCNKLLKENVLEIILYADTCCKHDYKRNRYKILIDFGIKRSIKI